MAHTGPSSVYQAELERISQYAYTNIDLVLKDMLEQLFIVSPEKPIDFMINFLTECNKRVKENDSRTNSVTSNNEQHNYASYSIKEIHRNDIENSESNNYNDRKECGGNSSYSSSAQSISPDHTHTTTSIPRTMRRRRTAVSSEPVAAMALEASQQTPSIPKTPSEAKSIAEAVKENFLFQGMDEKQQAFVVNAMFEKGFTDGDEVIKQGEPGDNFYVLADGVAECFVQKNDEEPVLVKTYKAGESFGELALMYNSPRAATIRAKGPIKCWAMNRVTFRRVLMDTTNEKRKLYEGFLGDVNILSSLDRVERSKVADALIEKTFDDGDFVIKQDEPGDNFYIVVDGEAVATKSFESGGDAKQVMSYTSGDYFGELALLNDKPRAANVVAKGRLTVVTLDRSCFVRLLGPCDEILKRNTSNYQSHENDNE